MPIVHSLIVSLTSVVCALIITTPISYYFVNKKTSFKLVIETLIMMPMVLPPTVIGLLLLTGLGKNSLLGGYLFEKFNFSFIFSLSGAVLATTIVILPILYQSLKSSFNSVDQSLVDVARTLSASRLQIFFRVVLPNCWPILVSGILLGFCRALGEFGATLMVAGYIEGKTDTVSTSIYFLIQDGRMNEAMIFGLINILIGIVALLIIHFLSTGKKVRN